MSIFIFHYNDEIQTQLIKEREEVKELWRFLKGEELGFVNKHSLQVVIGAIIGVNAKWMYLDEIVGDKKEVFDTETSEKS